MYEMALNLSGIRKEKAKLIEKEVEGILAELEMPKTTFIYISHQQTFSDMIKPTHTITLSNGKIMIQ